MTATTATVHIWIGSEWSPLREAFSEYLARAWVSPAGKVTICGSSLDAANPAGRVSAWLHRFLSGRDSPTTLHQPGDSLVLRSTDPPSLVGVTELLLDPDPAQVDQFYVLGIWTRFAPRRKQLLMRVTPFLSEEIVDNAALANPLMTVQIAEWKGQRVLIASTDIIAAEVIGRGVRTVAQPAGDIGQTPWQSDLVRIAGERSLGVRSGHQITLDIQRAGPMPPLAAHEFAGIAQAVSRMVDCAISFPNAQGLT